MTQCCFQGCRRKMPLITGFKCNACSMHFCSKHRLMEKHNCVMKEMEIERVHVIRSNALMEGKVVSSKLEYI